MAFVETAWFFKKLVAAGAPHEVLNAKAYREAQIIMNAGQRGAVTIANMAGRGTDIKLGEGFMNLVDCVIGTERHESVK